MLERLVKVTGLLQANKIDYCLIGGLAVMLHHGRASTVDIDLYVLVDDLNQVKELFEQKKFSVADAGEFQLKAKVEGVPIDILFADAHLGADVVRRAVEKKLGDQFVRVATPEDLIILKTIANRSVDRRDIEELRELFGTTIDEPYIKRKLAVLKKLVEK